jgi:hypothetical protein
MPLLVLHLEFLQLDRRTEMLHPTKLPQQPPTRPRRPEGLCFDDTSKAGRQLDSYPNGWLRAEEPKGSSRDCATGQTKLRVVDEGYGWPGVAQDEGRILVRMLNRIKFQLLLAYASDRDQALFVRY